MPTTEQESPAIDGPKVFWTEEGEAPQSALWHTTNGTPPPQHITVGNDRLTANTAYALARKGKAILWRGDYFNARQLLAAIDRRISRKSPVFSDDPATAFQQNRQAQALRSQILGSVLILLSPEGELTLRRAPDVREAVVEACGPYDQSFVCSLRELLGMIGAHEWRRKGIEISALGAKIHPHYQVFSPMRTEYLDLLTEAPLPSGDTAFDIGTGTGVLAAILAKRGMRTITATDNNPRALLCAKENIARLGFSDQVEVLEADLFPEGRASLAVCNPPWIPIRASSALESAVYDSEGRMLREFLHRLPDHLEPNGEGWLILSDFAEHIGLRTREELLALFGESNVDVIDRLDTKPRHKKALDQNDALHAARSAEVTSLWRLKPQTS